MKTYKYPIVKLEENQIFVFGSNTQGRHGKGASKWALENAGAIYGQPFHIQGRSFGIITKDLTKKVHPSIYEGEIMMQIIDLYTYAINNSDKEFLVAYRGTGTNLNGYTPKDMARFFRECFDLPFVKLFDNIPEGIPKNIVFEEEFSKLVHDR